MPGGESNLLYVHVILYRATDWQESGFRIQSWTCRFFWTLESFLSRRKVFFSKQQNIVGEIKYKQQQDLQVF